MCHPLCKHTFSQAWASPQERAAELLAHSTSYLDNLKNYAATALEGSSEATELPSKYLSVWRKPS